MAATIRPGGTRKRGAYRKTAETQERIVKAATKVFGVSGFDRGSLREVADEAGISHAGLLHHFGSKNDLLMAVVERRDDTARQQGQSHELGVDRLRAMIGYAQDSSLLPGEIELFAVLSAEATRPEHPAHEYMKQRYLRVSGILTENFRLARSQGHLKADVDPKFAARQLIGLWDGLQIQWLFGTGKVVVAEGLEALINSFLVAPLDTLCTSPRTASLGVSQIDDATTRPQHTKVTS